MFVFWLINSFDRSCKGSQKIVESIGNVVLDYLAAGLDLKSTSSSQIPGGRVVNVL